MSCSRMCLQLAAPVIFSLLLHAASVTGIPLGNFYSFGSGTGDNSLGSNDDGSSPAISLGIIFPYFNQDHSTVFVNNNGDISFTTAVSGFTPTPFPLSNNLELIAPYWADVDTRGTGNVWYRQSEDLSLLNRAGDEIQAAFPSLDFFTPSYLFIATWDHVGYYSSHTDKTNTFQCVMATDGTYSFVIFLYADGLIQWTTGDASGGSGGFGGTPAQVGFNAGDGVRFAIVPGSRTSEIIAIASTSNVGVDGVWIYRVDATEIVAPNDEVPDPPTNVQATSVSTTMATITWTAPGNIDQSQLLSNTILCTESQFGLSDSSNSISGSDTSYIVSGLEEHNTYTCAVAAANGVGSSEFSASVTFTTEEAAPSSAPESLSVITTSSTSIFLSWSPPPPIHQNGIIREYRISIREEETEDVFSFTSSSTSRTVTSLHPHYTYHCRVSAYTVGDGPATSESSAVTHEAVPSGVPQNFVAMATSSRSAVFSWDQPLPEEQNGIITGYDIRIIVVETGEALQLSSDSISLTVDTLSPFTTYQSIIAARTSVGVGPFSSTFTLRTPEDIPTGPPQNLDITVQSSREISLSWDPPPPREQNGIIREYLITVTEVETGSVLEFISTTTSLSVIMLHPYYTYQSAVAAMTIGVGPYSEVSTAVTHEEAPSGAPQNPTGAPGDIRQIVLAWEPPLPEDRNGVITGYIVDINSLDSEEMLQLMSTSNSITVSSLSPFTVYICTIAATTSVGSGPSSEAVVVQTLEEAPSSQPSNANGIALNSTHIELMWDPPPEMDHRGIIREYRINTTELDTGLMVRFVSETNEAVIGPLHPYYTYVSMITAFTVEEGPYSGAVVVRTHEDVPSAPPQALNGLAQSPTLITFTWLPPPPADINGVIDYYVVELTEVDTGRFWEFFAVDTQINIGSLLPYHFYECRVAAYTVGIGPFTGIILLPSAEDIPTAPPENITVTILTPRQVTLCWDPPPDDKQNGIIRQYIIVVTEVDTGVTYTVTSNTSDVTFGVTSDTTDITADNLLTFHSYRFSIAADTIAIGPFTEEVLVQVPEDAPDVPPESVDASATSATSVYLTWEPPPLEERNGIIRGYLVNVTETETGNMFQLSTMPNETELALSLLHPAYTYELSVSAVTVASGPYSVPIAIKTLEAAPSAPPRDISAEATSSQTAYLTWNPPPPEEQNGVITGYFINVTLLERGEMFQVFSETSELTVESLRPYSTYSFVITAQTIVGIGPFSTVLVVALTPEDVPEEPESADVMRVDGAPAVLEVTWEPPFEPNGVILAYTVYCYELQYSSGLQYDDDAPISPFFDDLIAEFSMIVPGNQTQTFVVGLTPFTIYECYITANTSVGEGSPSIIRSAQTDETIPDGPPSNLTASSVNSSAILLTWFEPINPNGIVVSFTIMYNTSGIVEQSGTITIPNSRRFTVTGLHADIVYEFSVLASTRVGPGPIAVAVAKTDQSSPDSPPENVNSSVLSSTSATITWTPPPPELQNGPIVYYSVVISDQLFNLSDIAITTSFNNYTFDDLQEYDIYSCKVAAATVVGVGPFSAPIEFRTLEDVPTSPPENLTGIANSSTVATFTWLPPPAIDVNGIIRFYEVQITERETGRYWSFFAIDASINLASLHPFFVYECIVATHTIATGPYTNAATVRTNEAAPSTPPRNLSVTSITSNSISLTWDSPLFDEANGIIRKYVMMAIENETGRVFTDTTNTTRGTLTALHPYYTYSCAVAAETVSLGPYSSPQILVQLPEDVPSGPPATTSGNATDSTTIILSWSPPLPENQNGIIRYYIINVTELDTGSAFSLISIQMETALLGLHPFYVYEISIASVTIGPGPSTTFLVKTLEDAPSEMPQNFAVTATNSRSISLVWGPPPEEHRNGIIIGYLISVSAVDPGEMFQTFTTNDSTVVDDLKPFTTYFIAVAAQTNAGVGPFSTTIQADTAESSPSSPPQDLEAVALSSTAISLTWIPPPLSSQNGIIREYTISITELETGEVFEHVSVTTSITVTTLHPHYSYSCTVSAYTVAMGPFTEAVTVMTLEDIPSGYPQNFQAIVGTSRSANLTWDPPIFQEQNGIITGYVIEVNALGIGETSQISTASMNLAIDNLFPFTTYQLRIAASTSIGTGLFSPAFTITTLEDVPTGPPQNAVGVAQSSRMISLSWEPPPPREQNGVIREYRINISEVETGEDLHFVSASTQLDVSMLHPFYTYEWVVTAYTIGNGPYTAISTTTTPEDVPSSAPQNLTGETLTSRQILLAWDPPLLRDHNGIITSYIVRVNALSTGEQLQFVTTSNNFTVSSLSPYTVYNCAVAATTSVGTGPFSEAITLQTMEEGPGSHPLNITGSAVSSTHIQLEWDPPHISDHRGIIREYRINVTELETGMEFQFTTEVNEILIGSLHPFYTYSCSISAATVDEGPFSDEIVIRTHEDIPSGPPRDLQVFATGSSMIVLSWEPPLLEQQNGIIRQYHITLVSGQTTVTTTMSTNVTISGLRPFTTYQCSVAALTISAGPVSGTISVTTPEDAPSAPPEDLQLDIVNSTTLALSWQPPATEYRNGIIRAFTIVVKEMETGMTNHYATDNTHITLADLHPFYTYSCSVAAETNDIGPFTAELTTQMPEDVPASSPLALVITNNSASSFLLSWRSPPFEDQNGIIRHYVITITEENTGRIFQMISAEKQKNITFLHPYYNYTCAVAAVTVGSGPYSMPITAATSEDSPSGTPENLHVEIQSSTSVTVTWDPPSTESQNGIITGYFINVTLLENEEVFQIFSVTKILFINTLKPFRTYNFVIAAQTNAGVGPYSRTVTTRTPEDAPSAHPEDLRITEITSTSVLLQWSPPPADQQNGIIRHYVIRVTEEDTGTSYSINTSIALEHTIGTLHPFYTYTFSVSAITLAAGPYTDDYSVKTLEDIPSAPPTLIEVAAVDSETLLLAWSPLAQEYQNGIIRGYVINISVIESGQQLQFTSNTTSLVIDDLHPHFTYNCIVAAITIGIGPFSAISRVQLPQDVPSAAPENLTGEALSSTSIIISWKPLPIEEQNGIIIHYTIHLLEVPTNRTLTYEQEGQHTMLVIDLLHPYYDYECSVGAVTVVGSGPFSEIVTTRTLPDIPSGSPRNVLVTAMSSTSVMVTWDDPLQSNQNGIIVMYTVVYTNLNRSGDQQMNSSTPQRQLFFPGLQEYEEYSFRVAAETTVGQGPFSDPSSVFTFEDVPSGPPLKLAAENRSSTSLRVTWDPPLAAERNGIIISYTVTYASTASTEMNETTSNTEIILESLNIFELYNVTVSANTINGSGPLAYAVERTSSDIPSEPLELAYRNLTATSIEVTWSPPANPNGIIERYSLVYTESISNTNTTVDIPGNQEAYNITDLMEYERYVVHVFAVTDQGRGPSSMPLDVLTDQHLPDAPEAFTVEALSSTAARAMWREPSDSNGILQGYILAISIVTSYLIPFNTTFQLRQHEFSLEISELHPFADYSLVLRARTVIGLGSETTSSVQTRQDVPSASPRNVVVTAMSSTSIMVTWDDPLVPDQNGIIILYTVAYLNLNRPGDQHINSSTPQRQLSFPGLQEYEEYSFRVAAETTVGQGPFSDPSSVFTFEDVPSAAPENLTGEAVSSTSITISWKPPPIEEQNGIIILYTIHFLEVPTNVTLTYQQEGQHTMLVIDSLHPNYDYECSVGAVTAVGNSPLRILTIRTLPDIPVAAPQNIEATAFDSNTIQLSWDPPPLESQNGDIQQYLINATAAESGETVQLVSTVNSVRINNLHPYYTYSIVISAVTIGPGPYSTPVTVTTFEDAPSGSPTGVVISVLSSTSLLITWQPPDEFEQNGIITGYQIVLSYQSEISEMYNVSGSKLSLQVDDLPIYTIIGSRIAAHTAVGTGPYSTVITARTLEDFPSAPEVNQQVGIELLNGTTVEFHWSTPDNPNGVILDYQVIYFGYTPPETPVLQSDTGADAEITDGPHTVTITGSLSAIIPTLIPGLSYSFMVRARTTIGYGDNSTAVIIGIPEAQSEKESGSVSSNSITAAVVVVVVVAVLGCMLLTALVIIYFKRRRSRKIVLRRNVTDRNGESDLAGARTIANPLFKDISPAENMYSSLPDKVVSPSAENVTDAETDSL